MEEGFASGSLRFSPSLGGAAQQLSEENPAAGRPGESTQLHRQVTSLASLASLAGDPAEAKGPGSEEGALSSLQRGVGGPFSTHGIQWSCQHPSSLPPVSLEELGRLKPGRTVEYTVWDREWKLFWGSLPLQGRGQKNKGHRCIPVCTGGRWGEERAPGSDDLDRGKVTNGL